MAVQRDEWHEAYHSGGYRVYEKGKCEKTGGYLACDDICLFLTGWFEARLARPGKPRRDWNLFDSQSTFLYIQEEETDKSRHPAQRIRQCLDSTSF